MNIIRHFAIGALISAVAVGPAQAVERILKFVSDVTVARNSDLTVTETIRVQAEQHAISHGILREFPTNYTRPDGSRVTVGFEVQSIMRDGADQEWTTEALGDGVRLRIGSVNALLAVGEHEYILRYVTTRQIGFFADHDELYWNVTGTGWTLAIDSAEASITLPDSVPFGQTTFYTGPQGAKGKDAMIVSQQPGHIVFRTTQGLPPQNGLTIAAAWPKGIVVSSPAFDRNLGRTRACGDG